MEIDKKVEVVVTTVEKDLEAEKEFGKRSGDFDAESQVSTVKSVGKVEFTRTRKPRWWQFGGLGPLGRIQHGLRSKDMDDARISKDKRRRCCKWLLIAVVVLCIFGAIASIIYITFVRMLISRIAPPIPSSGLTKIVESWKQPDQSGAYKFAWPSDFSQDITPKNCHSHNDYWRSVPLYAALAAGCSSVEADVWLTNDRDLRVGHIWSSTTPYRTLRSLYLDPLANILENRNVSAASANDREVGVFETDPNVSVVLLIDMKTDGHAIWPVLQDQLRSFRERNWLTYYDGTTQTMHHGPLTIVGTGQTPFELIQWNTTERWIFYDAPLMAVSNAQFDDTNSYYASTKFSAAVSTLWMGKFSAKQEALLRGQIETAGLKGLKSRYYGTPAWPIGLRDRVWAKLMELGVGVLNVDDLVSAARWNWGFCVVAGFVLCGGT